MNKTMIKFYRGCHGMGIVISVTYNKSRVIFDFGAPFEPLNEIYDNEVKHRIENRVKDAILLNKIPAIDYCFTKADLKDLEVLPFEDSDLTQAILVCHYHLDHMSEIDKIAKEIPVYMHKDGYKLHKCLVAIGEEQEYRDYTPFEYYEKIKVGQITVTPYFSDHPCAGSSSYLIQTPDQTILYSGDVRLHGLQSDRAYHELEKIGKNKIDLLIVDSTTTSPSEFVRADISEEDYRNANKEILPGEITESQIYQNTHDSLKDYHGLGIYNQYPRDTQMLKAMFDLANKLNRKLVLEPSYAYILYKLTNTLSCVYDTEKVLKTDYFKEIQNMCEVISIEEIKNNPDKYLIQNSYANIMNLTDLEGIKAKYFHLFGEPLVAGTKHYNIMLNVLNKLGFEFNTYTNLYSFSHTYPNHLAYLLQTINAKSVVAVHSKHPEMLNPVNSKQYFPEENIDYILEDGELKKAE